jgi:hypothetical protein
MPQAIMLPLRCPRCGGGLAGASHDVVFWCESCGVPQEVVGTGFVERTGKLARPALPRGGEHVYLPVWGLRVAYVCQWDDPEKEARAKPLPTIEWVYVSGFAIHNAGYYGDPGLIFTERRVVLTPRDAREPAAVVAGCARSQEEAKAFVEPHLLTIIDRRVDVTGLELSASVSEAILWGVPYFDDGETLQDGILGLKIPAAAVTELSEIRSCRGTR